MVKRRQAQLLMISSVFLLLTALPLSFAIYPPADQVPVTFYQIPLQANFVKNQNAIRDTVYEAYFRQNLYVYPEMIPPGREPINCTTQAMRTDFSDINTLMAPASVHLAHENAWCAYEDGQGFVASRTHWPNVTADQVQWWMWWHSANSMRYTLWHPLAHISVSSDFASNFSNVNLNHTEKLIGSTHHVVEIIGESMQDIDIHWKRPNYWGIDETQFEKNSVVASACGEIYMGPIKAVDMIHLWFQASSGLELRSRYFLGNKVQLGIPILNVPLDIDQVADNLKLKGLAIGPELSQAQFIHDQQEMTHLANVLPDIYAAFANVTR